MSDSSASPSSTSPSEGEYTLPQDERADESKTAEPMQPVFDVTNWKPEPPAGLQFMSVMPTSDFSYNIASSVVQHDLIGKVTATAQHRKNRHREFLKGSTVCRNMHDEKRLRVAVSSANCQLVEELLDSGVDPSCMDDKRRSPLHLAAALGSSEIVELLLGRGADPNQRDIIGNTALHLAACTNHFKVVTLLLRGGTDINAVDKSGNTPLHLARSRLRLLHGDMKTSSEKIKQEVSNIIGMMKEYLDRSGQRDDIGELDKLCHRLRETSTKEEVDVIGNLLSDFAELQIQRKDNPG